MNNRQARTFELLNAVVRHLNGDDTRLTESPRVNAMRLELTDTVNAIQRVVVEQNSAAVSRGRGGRRITRARDELRLKHLKPLVQDGKHILRGLPGIRDDLRLPHKLAPVEQHIESARHVRKIIAPHATAFIDRKYPRDFLQQLDTAVDELAAAAAVDRGAGRAKLSVATRELRELLAEGRLILDRLHATIHAEFAGENLLLANWDHLNRVPARRGRPPRKRRSHGPPAGVLN